MRLPDSELSRAILIGTSTYAAESGFGSLPSVSKNLIDLESFLADNTGLRHIKAVSNPPDANAIVDALETAIDEASDLLLFYYAGHGVAPGGELKLTHSSSRLDRAKYTTVDYSAIREDILRSHAAIKFVILDCCYSGAAFGSGTMAAGSSDPGIALDELSVIEGAYVLTATDTRTKYAESTGPGGCTAFTGTLLKVLKSGIPSGHELLTIGEVFPILKSQLRSANNPIPRARGGNSASSLALTRNAQQSKLTAKASSTLPVSIHTPSSTRSYRAADVAMQMLLNNTKAHAVTRELSDLEISRPRQTVNEAINLINEITSGGLHTAPPPEKKIALKSISEKLDAAGCTEGAVENLSLALHMKWRSVHSGYERLGVTEFIPGFFFGLGLFFAVVRFLQGDPLPATDWLLIVPTGLLWAGLWILRYRYKVRFTEFT
ncbi:caspase family protein [Rhodococcus sp. CX]|uniref:caspase family protein n=1 Tax=Rhodococcus sp. CX TaxID=2789880 RepID=UPI0018CECBD2|nr:caspase family protein [Rhodococcus sp. CX]MBH0120022.1 caspase family protein [Rhodococcus sp. CX]